MGSKDHTFDICSKVDFQEVLNAVDQSKKEISQRYDFKDSTTLIEWDKAKSNITITTESDFRLKAVIDILQGKLVKRGVSLRALDFADVEKAAGSNVKQVIQVRNGLTSEQAKEIVKSIKLSKIRVQAQIRESEVRVQSPKIDTLQEAIAHLKKNDYGADLQFENFR